MPLPKLAIITSHPIQYYAPVFRALSAGHAIDPRVFYTWSQSADGAVFDKDFNATVQWDIPLLSGYAHQFVSNVARRPGTDHFGGLDNPTLIAEIKAWDPDVILVYGWNSRSHLRVLRHFSGRLPVLFRGDSTLLDHRALWRTWLRRGFLRWVYSHVDVALAVGSNSRDYFAWCGLPPGRIAVAPHSVETARFAADDALRQAHADAWRRQLGIPDDAVVFLFAGKFQSKKHPLLLLGAFKESDTGAHLVFVGGGELEGRLRAGAGASANVHFIGFQNQSVMPTVYRLGDAYVLPSQGPGETWGLAMNEAMACGRIAIASSKVGGARDTIQSGSNGWIFASGDQHGLQRVMQEAVSNGRRGLLDMGETARRCADRWSTESAARAITEIVQECHRRR